MNYLSYICSNCRINLCSDELKLNKIYLSVKLCCHKYLLKILDIKLPNFNKKNILIILFSSDDGFQSIMNKVQNYLINKVMKREGKWERY